MQLFVSSWYLTDDLKKRTQDIILKHILGTLLVAQRTAFQIDPSIHQVLVR